MYAYMHTQCVCVYIFVYGSLYDAANIS